VADVHVGIEPNPSLEDGRAERSGVDGREGADLDVVVDPDPTELRNAPNRASGALRPTETRAPDHRTRTDDDAFAHPDPRVDHRVRLEDRGSPDAGAGHHDRARTHRHARLDARVGVDQCAFVNVRQGRRDEVGEKAGEAQVACG